MIVRIEMEEARIAGNALAINTAADGRRSAINNNPGDGETRTEASIAKRRKNARDSRVPVTVPARVS